MTELFDQDACPLCGVVGHSCPNFEPPPTLYGLPVVLDESMPLDRIRIVSMWDDPDPDFPPW